jgi:hypothetical protein
MKASSELDLVRLITDNKHSDVSFEQSPSAWLHKPIPYSALQPSQPFEYRHSTMIQILDEAVSTSRYKQSWDSYQLAFEENGLVFFTPFTTKVGDLVCQFPQSDVLATLSFDDEHGHKSAMISRALNFLTSPSGDTIDICGQSMSSTKSTPYHQYNVDLHLDTATVRTLTGPPGTPKTY